MKSNIRLLTLLLSTAATFAFNHGAANAAEHAQAHANAWSGISKLVAVLHPTSGNKCQGVVEFQQVGDKVKVVVRVEGLNPNQKHAIHIHQFGDATSTNGLSAGGHYNPDGHAHALPEKDQRHAGDLGNLQADAAGKATLEITVSNISLAGLKNPIVGRGVIVHAQADDGGQPVGNAGARIACGVIGIANPGN